MFAEAGHMVECSRRLRRAVFSILLLIALLLRLPAYAGTTGTIAGVVSDASGHPLANVQVAVASPSFATTTVTGGNGFYAVNGLPVDTYRISFSKAGFQTRIVNGV